MNLLKKNLKKNQYKNNEGIPTFIGNIPMLPVYVCDYQDIEKYINLTIKKFKRAYRKK